MSLQFIFGNSGSGKSSFLYQNLLEQAELHPEKNYLIIVPEQFTMQTQKELVRLSKSHAIMNVDVLSFARLAYRVFDELGKQNLVVLEETGKNLVLRKVAEQKKQELHVLGGNMNKMGYVSEMKSLISELSQYNISPDQLELFLSTEAIGETLRLKMQDVLTMYHGFRDYLEGKFVTSEEVLSLLCDVANESGILKDSVILFDEFTGFTPIQNQLLRKLFTIAEKIQVSLTMDITEDFYHCRGNHELFAMSKKTVENLLQLAEELHIPVEDPILFGEGDKKRYKNAPALYFMEQNLFRPGSKKWTKDAKEITLAVLKNPREELIYTAREITRFVREKNFCYKDIAVVTGDVAGYSSYVPEIFEQYEIPFFVDQTKNILFHPLIEFIRAALEVVEYDFSYESVFRFLRCGLFQLEQEEAKETDAATDEEKSRAQQMRENEARIDRLENFVLAKGIRGKSTWKKQWTFVLPDGTAEDILELNAFRKQIYEVFEPLVNAFLEKDGNVRKQTTALYEMLYHLKIEQQMKQKELAYQKAGNQAKAKEYAQIYRIVMELFEKVVALLGDEPMKVREYSDILDAGFEAAKVAVIPPGNDKVIIGDIERTRLNHIKVLFFLGVNDGIVPKAEGAGGIISQFEREKMAECHLELAPGAREKVFIQKFYLYLNMTKPSDFLYVTCARVNSAGKSIRRSYLIGTLLKMFPKKELLEIEEEMAESCVLTPKSSRLFFLEGLNGTEKKELWKALTAWYLSKEEYREETARLIDAAYTQHVDEPISHAVTKALYGEVLENSVTRLERFAACAFAHYLSYGLHLKERQIQEFASVDMGNIYHDALEHYGRKLEEAGITWFDVTEAQEEALITESMEEAIAGCKNAGSFENARNQYLLERMKVTIKRTIWALTTQVQKGKFIPSEIEVSFSRADHLDAIQYQLSEDEKMQLLGRIDRVDTYETEDKVYVKIIDYKSGNTSFSLLNIYHGLQLQLVVYLNAAMELVSKKYAGKKVEPAGIFYYHIDNPMVDGMGNETEAEIRHAVLEQLKLNGLVNSNPEVYEAMDMDFAGNSSVIPIGKKTDGSLKATSKIASTSEFHTMSEYVTKRITTSGKQIFAGNIAVHPYQLDQRTGCDYCPYHMICGFDTRIPGFTYEKMEKFDDADAIMEKMKGTE